VLHVKDFLMRGCGELQNIAQKWAQLVEKRFPIR
jgi:hypothetical protein